MKTLNQNEQELLAALSFDPAYLLIMEKIQALIDDLTDELYVTQDSKRLNEILPYWRALKTCYFELKNTPEQMAQILDTDKKEQFTPTNTGVANKRLEELFQRIQEIQKQEKQLDNKPDYENLI